MYYGITAISFVSFSTRITCNTKLIFFSIKKTKNAAANSLKFKRFNGLC